MYVVHRFLFTWLCYLGTEVRNLSFMVVADVFAVLSGHCPRTRPRVFWGLLSVFVDGDALMTHPSTVVNHHETCCYIDG